MNYTNEQWKALSDRIMLTLIKHINIYVISKRYVAMSQQFRHNLDICPH